MPAGGFVQDDAGSPCMVVERAKTLFAFMEGAVINSCFMGVPCGQQPIRRAIGLIMGE